MFRYLYFCSKFDKISGRSSLWPVMNKIAADFGLVYDNKVRFGTLKNRLFPITIIMVDLCTKTSSKRRRKSHTHILRMEDVKMKNLKKASALLLAFTMTCTLFVGCGDAEDTGGSKSQEQEKQGEQEKQEQSSETDAAADDAWKEVSAKVDIPEILRKDPEHLSWMDTTDPITLSVFYANYTGDFPGFSTPVEQHITELTGVTLDGTYRSVADASELTLMLSSGDKLPDFIARIDTGSEQYRDMVETDTVWDLKELIDTYCPEMWDLMDPYIRDWAVDEDGHMYNMPIQCMSEAASDYAIANGWVCVRGDICKELGIEPESIKTLEDVENALAAFTKRADEWPEVKYPLSYNTFRMWTGDPRPWYNVFGGYGLNYGDGGLDMIYDKEAGTVHWWIEDEIGYKALKYMNKLNQLGYTSEANFNIGSYTEECEAGSIFLLCGTNMWEANAANTALAGNVEGAYYQRIPLFSETEDKKAKVTNSMNSLTTVATCITKDCENPERAIKFLEFLCSEYGNLTVTSGVYGVDWEESKNDLGVNTVKYIGEATTAEGRAKRGIYNHMVDWLAVDSAYDYINAYSTGDPIMAEIPTEDWLFNTYAGVPVWTMTTEPYDTEYSIAKASQQEIINNFMADMILAKNDAEFDALYEECLSALEEAGLDKLKEHVAGLCKEYIAKMEAAGVVFQ